MSGPATISRKKKGSTKARTCRVCGNRLTDAAEVKLGHHHGCEVNFDERLFDELRAWRKATAEEAKVPAFVVFTDATLQAIAEAAPTDEAGLLWLPGIGRAKVDKYGAATLEIVRSHEG